MRDFTRADALNLANELAALGQEHKFVVDFSGDFGFRVEIADITRTPPIIVTACQPRRKDVGQNLIFRSVKETLQILNDRRLDQATRTNR